eukprot:Rmarinus@m.18777
MFGYIWSALKWLLHLLVVKLFAYQRTSACLDIPPEKPIRDLTEEEIEQLNRDGVIVVRQIIPKYWISRMAKAVDQIRANPTPIGRVTAGDLKGYHMEVFLYKLQDDFRDFVWYSPCAWLAQQALQTKSIRFFYDQMFVKEGGADVPTPWHQDLTFWPIQGEKIVSLWMPLERVTPESSGLEYVVGSHRWPSRFRAVSPDHNPTLMNSDLPLPPDINKERDKHTLVSFAMEPGDVLMFHPLTLHGSAGNSSTQARRAVSLRFVGEDTTYAPRPATMPIFFENTVKAGEPVCGKLFPQILPEKIAEESAHRALSLEFPDSVALVTAVADIVRARVVQVFKKKVSFLKKYK